nr:MAG TPA: hypothetical protein [Caudoviricetes sp.]
MPLPSEGKDSTAARFLCGCFFLRVCRLAAATGFSTSALAKLHKRFEGRGTRPYLHIK